MKLTIKTCLAMLTIPIAISAATWHDIQPKPEADLKPYDADDVFGAAEYGDLETVKRLVEKDPKTLHKIHAGGYTLLNWAALYNQPEIVRYLLKKGVKVDAMGPGEITSLYCAATSPKAFPVESGRVLIKNGANVNFRLGDASGIDIRAGVGMLGGSHSWWGWPLESGTSILDTAARTGHADLVKLLLKKGATPFTYRTYRGKKYLVRTSLHRACRAWIAPGYLNSKDPDIVREYEDNHKVIDLLAPVVKDINIKDVDGRTPLHIAAFYGRAKVAAYLLKKYPKVDINAKADFKNTPLHLAVKAAVDAAKKRHQRSFNNRLATIQILLKHKPDLMAVNFSGHTPHELARASGRKELIALLPTPAAAMAFELAKKGKLEALKKIVDKQPAIVKKFDHHGYTLLHNAAEGNQTDVIRYLVKKGADLESHDSDTTKRGSRLRPLHAAASADSFEAARLLIELGADPKARIPGDVAMSALDFAASGGDERLVKLLLKKGASPFTKPKLKAPGPQIWAWTSLHSACTPDLAQRYKGKPAYAGNRKVIRLLVPAVKDVNVRIELEYTPLHLAAASGSSDVVDFLLKTFPKTNVNAKDEFGNTPLHLALRSLSAFNFHPSPKRRVTTIKVLLKHKPDLTIKNRAGKTPRDLARGNKAIMALFP